MASTFFSAPMRAATASAWATPVSARCSPGARPGRTLPVVGVWPCRTYRTRVGGGGFGRRGMEFSNLVSRCMTSWKDFATAEPELAARVQQHFESRKHMTLATVRRDGSPQISGTEVAFRDGELTFGMDPASLKA